MEITAWNSGGPTAGSIVVKVDDGTYSRFPVHVSFEVHDHPMWRIQGVVYTDTTVDDPNDMTPELLQVTITARPGGPPIHPDMIRGVKLGAIRDGVLREISEPMELRGQTLVPVPDSAGTADARTVKAARARKGRRVTDDDLRQAAAAYEAVVGAGRTDRTVAVAEVLHLSTATASRRIQGAMRRGFITEDN